MEASLIDAPFLEMWQTQDVPPQGEIVIEIFTLLNAQILKGC